MKDFAVLYFWYKNILFKFARVLIISLLFVFSILGILNKIHPNFALIILGLYLMFEAFFIYKVSKLIPLKLVSENSGDPKDSATLETLSFLSVYPSSVNLIKNILKLPQNKFIVEKADGAHVDIQFLEIDIKTLLDKALVIVKELNGLHITTMDIFVAYLLLTEGQTKFLFNKKLKELDIKNILIWARVVFAKDEYPKAADLSFAGEGFGESLVYGWTLETSKYMVDLSSQFLDDTGLTPTGRKNEYLQIMEALSKNSSALLVGEAGSGRESAVQELAVESYSGRLKGNLFHQRIYELMVDAFMAGAQNQGDIEERLHALIGEISHAGNVIIYIPEFQNILGSTSFNLDISGALMPYLKNGNIRIIAAVTPGAYKRFVEPLHSLLDNFAVINFAEPAQQEVLAMLFRNALDIERKNKVGLTYKAIVAACEYAGRYVKEKVLPGSAVTLLDDTANAARIANKPLVEEQDIFDQVQTKTRVAVGDPKPEEKQLLLNLETELHKRIIDQNEAVTAISESIRRLRAGVVNAKKPISFLFLGPTGVGKTETAKALADVYFGNSERLVRLDMSEFSGEDGMKRLLGSGPGEGDEKGQLTEPVYDSPYSLVLLDEFEKADPKILNLFLQVLDDGRLTDNKGKTVSFINTIIIATSNAASEFIREEIGKGTVVDKAFQGALLNYLQTKGIFKPELLNRFDAVITFRPLGQEQVVLVIKMMIAEVTKRLVERDIKITFDDKVLQKIAVDGFDKDFGARPLRRFIQDKIEDTIAQKMLKDEIKRGDIIAVTVDESNNIVIK